MKRLVRGDIVLAVIAFFYTLIQGLFLYHPTPAKALTSDQLLIVSNRTVADSGKLARYYIDRRQVPMENWLQLRTSSQEQISRKTYEEEIAAPLRAFIQRHDPAGSRFRCILLLYGIPLRVQPPLRTSAETAQWKNLRKRLELLERSIEESDAVEVSQRQALQDEAGSVQRLLHQQKPFHKGAAVDSELALVMEESYALQGWTPNRFYAGLRGKAIVGLPERVLLVSRLDGPAPEVVRRMIDDSLVAEQIGLSGMAYFDARWPKPEILPTSAYGRYDAAIHNTARLLRQSDAVLVVLDEQERLFQPGEAPAAALYNGWYSLGKYVDAFDWVQGAVGFHVASGECITLKKEGSRVWCKAMLEDGVAATVGPVAEPYLQSFPSPEIFFGCLVQGQNELAECYAMANPFWSWQMVLIGDPLYRPFKQYSGMAQVQAVKGFNDGL